MWDWSKGELRALEFGISERKRREGLGWRGVRIYRGGQKLGRSGWMGTGAT